MQMLLHKNKACDIASTLCNVCQFLHKCSLRNMMCHDSRRCFSCSLICHDTLCKEGLMMYRNVSKSNDLGLWTCSPPKDLKVLPCTQAAAAKKFPPSTLLSYVCCSTFAVWFSSFRAPVFVETFSCWILLPYHPQPITWFRVFGQL